VDDSGVDVARGWSLRLVAGLAVGAAVSSGCSGGQEAADTLPSADAPSATEEQLPPLGPEEFPVPDSAREKTPEGALEFTRYYIDLGSLIATDLRDPQPLLDLSLNCLQCRRVAESYAEDIAAGFRYVDFSYSFRANGPGLIDGDTAQVGFVYQQGAANVVDKNNALVPGRSTPATEELQSGSILKWDDHKHSWLVTELTIG
jgi:hypothetical protein